MGIRYSMVMVDGIDHDALADATALDTALRGPEALSLEKEFVQVRAALDNAANGDTIDPLFGGQELPFEYGYGHPWFYDATMLPIDR